MFVHMRRILTKAGFVALGCIFIALAVVGAMLPVMPSVPFLVLAAACLIRGSRRLHRLFLRVPWVGRIVDDYHRTGGIRPAQRRLAYAGMWAGLLCSGALFSLAACRNEDVESGDQPISLLLIWLIILGAGIMGTVVVMHIPAAKDGK